MKKLLVLSVASLLLLAGCSDAKVKISNESQVVATIGDKKITRKDYDAALQSYKYSSTVEIVKQSLYDEFVPMNDEVNQLVEKQIAQVKQRSEQANISWEDSLKNFGTTEEEYRNQVIIPAVRSELLAKKYVSDHFDTYITKFGLIKFNILEAKDDENANKAIEAIKNGKSFNEAASEFGITTKFNGDSIVTGSGTTTIVADVYAAISSADTEVNKVASSAGPIYVYQLISKDPTAFKDEAISEVLKSSTVVADAFNFYLTEKKIQIFDIDVFKGFESQYKSAIKK